VQVMDCSLPGRAFSLVGHLPPTTSPSQIGGVTESAVIRMPLPDDGARERIASDLDTNLLVEAGAGSGKTTALVGRLVALIRTGTATVDEIAAVTFTRKAAAELRERFQTVLEAKLREARDDPAADELETDRLRQALDDIDRAFIGTIHSFCGRLLRERPLDVGLDPGFEELRVEERVALRRVFWEAYLERLARDSDPILEELSAAGLRPARLDRLFHTLVENPDVDFPAESVGAPVNADIGPVRDTLDDLVSRAWELMDDMPPAKGWDSLQKKLRRLHFEREITGWKEPADLFEALAVLCKSPPPHKPTFIRWRDKELTRSLAEDVNAFAIGDTPARKLVDQWYAHRYSLAIRLCQSAADAFADHRLRIGKLDFQDLLVLAARLLRENPRVRTQLGARYRRLLVDEFQDTDPLQAEIMMLLSADSDAASGSGAEEGEDRDETADWRVQRPRPGALFVVGDPKQSIYRFRRADIQLYGFVRGRFEDFGEVLTLSTNFRSRPPIGDLVNGLFPGDDFFPADATEVQAAFERLDTRPPEAPVPCEGVFTYVIDPEQRNKFSAATDDAQRIASWIRDRIEAGERQPADFLILTRQRGNLDAYARALESRDLPVQVTGAGVGVEAEIHELCVLLECMIDPTNPVKVVSALVGLFFGIDYEKLVTHRLDGGGFDVMWPRDDGHPEVVEALQTLHGWWRESVSDPADVFLGRLVSQLGLLPFAAAGDLGSLRAGALLYALDAVRAAAFAGDTSLPGALSALLAALELKEAEAPLEPGRPDAIRLMNLHQAKGLEGTVVILANPTERKIFPPDEHMARSVEGVAQGFLRVSESAGAFKVRDLARPLGWSGFEAAEAAFERAEEVRLLYVAVTRAREELVIGQWPDGKGKSVWAALDPWLADNAVRLELTPKPPPERDEIRLDASAVAHAVSEAKHRVESARTPTHEHTTVTHLAKSGDSASAKRSSKEADSGARARDYRGFAWGSAVHGALAVAATDPGDRALRAACRDLLVEHQRPLDDHGEPIELKELLDLVQTVRASKLWARAESADRKLVEVAFAVPGITIERSASVLQRVPALDGTESEGVKGGARRQLDMFSAPTESTHEQDSSRSEPAGDIEDGSETPSEVAPTDGPADSGAPDGGHVVVLEGVVDLAFRERGGWVIADYKTDVGTDPDFESRTESYRRQVDLYAEAWSRLTGEPVKERVLFYTAQGRIDSW
jgi:ATP-dependent helicase/nuclease subunit A